MSAARIATGPARTFHRAKEGPRMANKSNKDPSSTSANYDRQAGFRAMIHTLLAGTQAMRDAARDRNNFV